MATKSDKYNNLTSVVERVIFYNEQSKWGVLSVRNPLENDKLFGNTTIILTGNFEHVYAGCEVVFSGTPIQNPKYGMQLSLSALKPNKDVRSKEGIINFLRKSGIHGISTQNAKKIYDRFGDKSIQVVLHETHRIKEIHGIGEGTYQEVVESVGKYIKMESLLEYCISLGIPYIVIYRLYEVFGDEALPKIKDDIYSIIEISDEFSFNTIDEIALKTGVKKTELKRLKAAIVYCTKTQVMMSSSTGIAMNNLRNTFAKVTGVSDTQLFRSALNTLIDSDKIIIEGSFVYWKYYYDKEEMSAKLIKMLLNTPINNYTALSELPARISDFEQAHGFELNEQQREAVFGILSSRIAILTGGPGTGKTTITEVITNALMKAGIKFYLLSPTGKATRRLSECTGYDAHTIHKFLNATSGDLSKCTPPIVGNNAAIIIDESSMMDTFMLNAIMGLGLKSAIRVYFVGDKDQLPSVQVGNVLSDMIGSDIIPTYVLTDIMRQSADSHIIKYCADINAGEMLKQCEFDDFIYTEYFDDVDLLDDLTKNYAREVKENGLLNVQVIAPYKGGELGTINLNKILAQEVNKVHKRYKSGFAVNDKVMQIRNDYSHNIFNGECGVITDIREDSDGLPYKYDVYYDSGSVIYDDKSLSDIILSYATTCHKSQGAEFPVVFIVLDDSNGNFLLTRKLLYTAVSRGKKKVYIYSKPGCLKKCIKNDSEVPRITNLMRFLQTAEPEELKTQLTLSYKYIEEVPF